jgi:hypothetical protein
LAAGTALGFDADIGKAAGGVECLNTFADAVTIERLTGLLRNQLTQVLAIVFRAIGKLYALDCLALISRYAA